MLPPLLLLILFFCFGSAVDGQSDGVDASPSAFNPKFNPSMAVIIVILITAFFFIGFFSIYLRQCGGMDRDASTAGSGLASARSRRTAVRGVDPAVLEKFPLLLYSDVRELKVGKGAFECSVCLSEFEDDEMLRLLPKCSHAFHPDCIGMWLASHTTCPVCRANLAAAPDLEAAATANVVPAAENTGHPSSPLPEQRAEETIPVEQVAIAVDDEPRAAMPEAVLILSGSRKRTRSFLPLRSGSARPALGGREGLHWAEEERERFTLRLPEHVRRDVLAGKLSRSASVAAFRTGEDSSRRGRYRMWEGSSRGGRSFKREWAAKSDRWVAFLSTPLSFKLTRGGGDGEGSTKRGGGEGSKSGKGGGRLDCLGGGTAAAAAAAREKEEEEGAAVMVAVANKA